MIYVCIANATYVHVFYLKKSTSADATKDTSTSTPDSDSNDVVKSVNHSSSNPENSLVLQRSAKAHTSVSTVTKDNVAVNHEGRMFLLNKTVYNLGDHPNEPTDMSTPSKPGGFYPKFFTDDNPFSPIIAQSCAHKCSKGT